MINYQLLNDSLKFYEKMGYKRIEAPWLVTEAINNITKPIFANNYYVSKSGKTKTFVASGEQSFLYLINKGFLPEGKYQTITPCMRNDDFDQWHTKYFMKNELIEFGKKLDLDYCISSAKYFFKSNLKIPSNLIIVEHQNGYDIEYHAKDQKIELGSYGIRKCDFCEWVYGTGLAEPRFSRVLKCFEE